MYSRRYRSGSPEILTAAVGRASTVAPVRLESPDVWASAFTADDGPLPRSFPVFATSRPTLAVGIDASGLFAAAGAAVIVGLVGLVEGVVVCLVTVAGRASGVWAARIVWRGSFEGDLDFRDGWRFFAFSGGMYWMSSSSSSSSSSIPCAVVRDTVVAIDGPLSSSLLAMYMGGVFRRVVLLRFAGLATSGVDAADRLTACAPLRSEPIDDPLRDCTGPAVGVRTSLMIRGDGVCGDPSLGPVALPAHQCQA